MYFTIKIIRFFVRLFLKVLLFPFRLLGRLVGSGTDDDYDADLTAEPTSTSDTSSTAARQNDADARKHISWFQKGLYAYGGIQLVLGFVMLIGVGDFATGAVSPVLIGGVVVGFIVVACIPILIGALLPRYPTKAWYAGMGFVGLMALLSLAGLPASLPWLAGYAAILYLGYSGRPALASVFGDATSVPYSPTTATEPEPEPVDPALGGDPAGDESASEGAAPSNDPTETAAPGLPEHDDVPTEAMTPGPSRPTEPDAAPDTEASADPVANDAVSAEADPEPADVSPSDDASTSDDSAPEPADGPLSEYEADLEAADPEVRASAVRDLADAVADDGVPDQATIDALEARLDDDAAAVRVAACEALGRLGVADAEPRLRDLRIDPDSEVSRAASRALRDLE